MANGIVIHISAGDEKRTEYFQLERIRIGADAVCDLRFEPANDGESVNEQERGVWLELRREQDFYRVTDYKDALDLFFNGKPIEPLQRLNDGDSIAISQADISLSFFHVKKQSALTATAKPEARPMRFIETAALEAADSEKRDDAKVFLREFVRELVREVSWLTKTVILLIVILSLSGVFYLGFLLFKEMQRNREIAEEQQKVIVQLNEQLTKNGQQITSLDERNKTLIDIVSLAPNLRQNYGNGICLLVGTYDLVDKRSGRQLRYPDPAAIPAPDLEQPMPPSASPAPAATVKESKLEPSTGMPEEQQSPLTTEGYGTPVEFDFVGTGFHVGSGYIVTNRHVVQPWADDERINILAKMSNGRTRLKKLVVYFPAFPQPFPLKVRETSRGEDLAVASLDPNSVFPDIPTLPLDTESDAARVGKTVVTMGYPSGPDRILAMVDESEARTIQTKYGQSLQTLVNYLAQAKKISPLTTQGTITDLDAKRVTHDAKTAEGGSGAPLFGQNGRVIGVNFGVFTENTAANMAIPIKYIFPLLKRAGWKSAEEQQLDTQTAEADKQKNGNSNANTNANVVAKTGKN